MVRDDDDNEVVDGGGADDGDWAWDGAGDVHADAVPSLTDEDRGYVVIDVAHSSANSRAPGHQRDERSSLFDDNDGRGLIVEDDEGGLREDQEDDVGGTDFEQGKAGGQHYALPVVSMRSESAPFEENDVDDVDNDNDKENNSDDDDGNNDDDGSQAGGVDVVSHEDRLRSSVTEMNADDVEYVWQPLHINFRTLD
jgi:hypothetical protein